MSTLYVFIDESGNLDFSLRGTKYFVLAAVATFDPVATSCRLQELKYQLLSENQICENFHASEDRQAIRDMVYPKIASLSEKIKIYYLFAKKCKTYPALRPPDQFYGLVGGAMVKYLLKVWKESAYEKIIIIFDKALKNKDQNAFLKELKPKLKKIQKPYFIHFHRAVSDFNSQIADYAAWAKFVSLEKEEQRPLEALSSVRKSQFDIFHAGIHEYY